MEHKKHLSIPQPLATACGLAIGASLGKHAGEAMADCVMPHMPHAFQEHAGVLTHVAEAAMAVGGGSIGFMLGAEKPAEAVFLAIAAAPTIFPKPHGHSDHLAVEPPPTDTASTTDNSSHPYDPTEFMPDEFKEDYIKAFNEDQAIWEAYTATAPYGRDHVGDYGISPPSHDSLSTQPIHASPSADAEVTETTLHLLI